VDAAVTVGIWSAAFPLPEKVNRSALRVWGCNGALAEWKPLSRILNYGVCGVWNAAVGGMENTT